MPSSKKPKPSWIWFAKFAAVAALILLALSLFRPTDRDRLVRAANKGYEIIEPSPEYLRSQASLLELIDWAEKGSPAAQTELAFIYRQGGGGVRVDLDKAAEWARKAASQDKGEYAIRSAGLLYALYTKEYPKEKQSRTEAEKWLKVQADCGNFRANTLLGMHMLGIYGDPFRPTQSVIYLDRAAQEGDGNAIYWLGECFANGWGVEPDATEAIKYLKTASDSQNRFIYKSTAQRKLAEAYEYGYGVSKNQTSAFEYYMKSACGGDLCSMAAVANAYYKGRGVVPSDAIALAWVYVNRACGGDFSDKLVRMMEEGFTGQELSLIRNRAGEIVAEIKLIENLPESDDPPAARQSEASTGTGVVISSEGLVVTAAHVIEGAKKIEVCLPGGNRTATVVEVDPKNDLAVLRIEGSGYPAAPLVPSSGVKLGQPVFTIGFPNTEIQGASPKFTRGEISSVSGARDEPTQWQISVPVQNGNSGSPLFDESGNVVGIVVSKLNAFETARKTGDLIQNVNYAVKNAYLMPMLEKFPDQLPAGKKRGIFKRPESVVEDSKKSVVLILAY
jgi:S1-C subfamily serine protease